MEMSVIKIRQYKLLYKTFFLSEGLLLVACTYSKDYLINVALLTADRGTMNLFVTHGID